MSKVAGVFDRDRKWHETALPIVKEVVLDDGRTGQWSFDPDREGSEARALSKAIEDANSKPVPKK